MITVFQVGGVKAYAHDIEIPREYGVDQIVGDTLGPGGVFRGLRTIEALRVVAETMLEVCPDALLLNYTNPMSANIWATDLRGVRVIGLCHSVQEHRRAAGPRARRAAGRGHVRHCAGVNHTAWFTTFRRGDEDLIPRIREVMTARYIDETEPLLPGSDDPYESIERVRAELMQLTGYFHTESSHHASEYWAWFRRTPELVEPLPGPALGQPGDRHPPTRTGGNAEIVEEARREGLQHGGELAAPIMDSVVTGTPRGVLRERPQRRLDHQPARRRLRRGGLPGRRHRGPARPVRRAAARVRGPEPAADRRAAAHRARPR